MSWIGPIIKGLAWATVPVKIIDKGLDHAKNEIKEEISHYEEKLKIMVLLGSGLLLTIIFLSITIALLLGIWINSITGGFAIIAGIFLLVFVSLLVTYKEHFNK